MIDRESLARMLHEAGRKAVEAGNTVAAEQFGEQTRTFIEWDDLSEPAREGRRIQADYLLENLYVEKPEPQTSEDRAVASVLHELHRAQVKHPGRIILRHQAWGIIDEEMTKLKGSIISNDDYDRVEKYLNSVAAMCIRTKLDMTLIKSVESDLTALLKCAATEAVPETETASEEMQPV